jgi:hypothetical protein
VISIFSSVRAARECKLGATQYTEDILLASLPRKQLALAKNKKNKGATYCTVLP